MIRGRRSTIAFHMVRVDGDLLIDRLDIVPAG